MTTLTYSASVTQAEVGFHAFKWNVLKKSVFSVVIGKGGDVSKN